MTWLGTKRVTTLACLVLAFSLLAAVPDAIANPKVLTVGALGGEEAAVADSLDGRIPPALSATFASGIGNVNCESSLTGTVSGNPETGGGAKAATLSVFNWSFQNCTTTFPANPAAIVTTRDLNYTMSVSDAAGLPITISKPGGKVKFEIEILIGLGSCTYQATEIKGRFENGTNKIAFANQGIAKVAGAAFCPALFSFSANYTPWEDVTFNPAKKVFVN